jgi:hypothetical protein
MKIPDEVKKMLMEQGLIFIATSNRDGIPNVSPRTAYWLLDDETIAICDWFRHKTYWNWQENNYMAIGVVDLESFTGWQLKGPCELITDPNTIKDLLRKVMTKPPHAQFNRTLQKVAGAYPPIVVKFRVEEIYSLAPKEEG